MCKHENFNIRANVGRILHEEKEPPAYYSVEIRISCRECDLEFEWQGLPNGFSPYEPTVSIDGLEMRVSAMPPGLRVPPGLPGYRVVRVIQDQAEDLKQ